MARAVLTALGDPTRQAIVERLRRGPMAVGELARELPVTRPAVSQHLKVLKEAGLVSERPEGTRRVYSLSGAGFEELRAYVEAMWSQALGSFKKAADEQARRSRGRRG